MELYQVRAFVTVARIGNVTKAAEALHVTQPAVTGQLKSLEQSLGVTLFDRSAGRLTLTRTGELLLPKAEALLAAGSELSSVARQLRGELTGRIDFGLPSEPADFLRLGEMAASVHQALPLVELRTRSYSSLQLLDLIRAGTLSAGYFIDANPPRDLQWVALRSVTYRVAVPVRMSESVQRGGWRTLAELPWVDGLADSHIHQLMRALFERQGLAPRIVMQAEETSGLDAYVRAGSGCALLREEVAVRGSERQDWMIWGPAQLDAKLYLVTSAEGASDPLTVALTSMIRGVWNQ
ncbi:LysR family transcriptional regulator [Acidovorax sp. sif1233]|jgi:DNA-binding transcriptional LysR family regulator|uniref:LysR family transcriptional regulator n=1 Tax=unclassified Acidovorax TaxID=2684926 RepID=UPI001C47D44B|nr:MULTISPECIES: LysR family transcriptional regulator [unclassified Acidovorax]MBV7427777.1 LysR family transcriptional regulator [Acidovorax sp. sif0732]MBV7450137.1 LysR family transcriptional regulator [Acidovorax sp. sif0715]MBV7455263.1 LysR family transcriptional regulator [Acidovorax sp. sif1233]